jgi:UDP-N-acetylmuramate dehydrogenase
MHVLENKPLAPLTTFQIGGPARWFVDAATEDEIIEAADWARQRGVVLFVLGGGSNLLVADAGFDGLVLHIGLLGISVEKTPDHQRSRIYRAAAGEDWDRFVECAAQDGCAGVECLAGIPGTVGGTPVQNVGAYGQEAAFTIERVRAYDLCERAFVELTAAECGFSYRHSRFNSADRGRFIVTRVDFRLTPGGAPALRYADLQRAFEAQRHDGVEPTLVEVAAEVRRIRQSKGMLLVDGDPDCRSAGSFFKNPVVSEEHAQRIATAAGKEPPRFPAGPGMVKVPAAWLIEHAGFAKGYQRGAAGISTRHTLALINRGSASASDVLALAAEIRSRVQARFGVALKMEPVLVGFPAEG